MIRRLSVAAMVFACAMLSFAAYSQNMIPAHLFVDSVFSPRGLCDAIGGEAKAWRVVPATFQPAHSGKYCGRGNDGLRADVVIYSNRILVDVIVPPSDRLGLSQSRGYAGAVNTSGIDRSVILQLREPLTDLDDFAPAAVYAPGLVAVLHTTTEGDGCNALELELTRDGRPSVRYRLFRAVAFLPGTFCR